ncbi:MAG: Bax inhibitor-1/YccA family protein [Magnetococcales bacterium]|nr:Bax inhibitor-1/YccA family protein [Magnetococcales bacterium]
MLNDPKYPNQDSPWGASPVPVQVKTETRIAEDVTVYLKQVYALLASSLIVAVAAGYVGMTLPFAREHPIILLLMMFGAMFLAFRVQNAATLFLFTGISGLSLGPVIAYYVGAGLSAVVGQAALMTGAVFTGLSVYSLTTKRNLSMMGGVLFAGLIIIVVGGLINLFVHSSALSFAMAGMGAVIFAGYILYETQQLKENPWAVAPSVAALSMYLNVVNLFTSLLRLLGMLGGED